MESFRVEAKHCGFQPGVDLARLNQISDDLDLDVFRCGAGEAGGP
jgi:saccharopine dehydrogenase-like NADP-dependent oxidoreductase